MIALEAKYHAACLTSLYNRARSVPPDNNEDNPLKVAEGIALAQLISYIKECRTESNRCPVFRLADLAELYDNQLSQIGDVKSNVHSTRLKDRILSQLPDLRAFKQGRDILLAFQDDVGAALQSVMQESYDDEAMHLAKAANILRRDILAMKNTFNGSFSETCQKDSIPRSLLSLVNMVLNGSNIKQQNDPAKSQTCLSISQLLQYNSYARRRGVASKQEHCNRSRETPLPIFIGLLIHGKTRNRDLIDALHSLGLSVSYERVLGISTEMCNSVCRRYDEEGVVCPLNLRKGLFTTAALDNIDHNPSSTTAQGSFHGTGISLFQNPSDVDPGTKRDGVVLQSSESNSKSVLPLPHSYTNIAPIELNWNERPVPPKANVEKMVHKEKIEGIIEKELQWTNHVNEVVESRSESLEEGQCVSWSAYHASNQPDVDEHLRPAISSLLPLFPDHAASVAMIRHSMDVIKKAVQYLNPNQVPVIAADQPLFAIAKQIQWNWPDTYGEKHFVVVFGGLHIEMAFQKVLGKWLDASGWTAALSDAKIASSGTAESFVKATNVARTRKAHESTACSLYVLLKKAYSDYQDVTEEAKSFEDWCSDKESTIPQFHFWYLTFKLELLYLSFVRSLREASFSSYANAFARMIPWFFAFDRPNYARWLPIHLRDMHLLQDNHPDIAINFARGEFTVRKTQRKFSALAIDQAHEQNNAVIKGDGGAVGLTENESALRRWMVSGSEIARIVNEFESSMKINSNSQQNAYKHHEEQQSTQMNFFTNTKALVAAMQEMGNPFIEEGNDRLDSKDVAAPEVIATVRSAEAIGIDCYKAFVEERLKEQSTPLMDPIKRNNLHLFSSPKSKTMDKTKQQIRNLKNDCALFSRLYISCQIRNGNMEFFSHENQPCPPSTSDLGKLRLPSNKSELITCLEEHNKPSTTRPEEIDFVVVDGATVANMVKPGSGVKTFADYAEQSFLPYLRSILQYANRVDVVWDTYLPNSLKASTRMKRGSGVRRKVEAKTETPRNWPAFLRNDDNKSELFAFLAKAVSTDPSEKLMTTTYGQNVLCNQESTDTTLLEPCNHEEADTRIFVHVADGVKKGMKKIMIRTVDTDVLVLAIRFIQQLQEAIELWIAFGAGSNFRYIPAHAISRSLGKEIAKSLPFFHAYTGCDTVSCFGGRGKKTGWLTWQMYPEATRAFEELSNIPENVSAENLGLLERFTVLLYDRTSLKSHVIDARQQLFAQKGRKFDNIPPTLAALQQHIKRATYQGGQCWGQVENRMKQLPSPADWGWQFTDGSWEPIWSTLPDVTASCTELICYKCKKGCKGRCSCSKAALQCTALCLCSGQSENIKFT